MIRPRPTNTSPTSMFKRNRDRDRARASMAASSSAPAPPPARPLDEEAAAASTPGRRRRDSVDPSFALSEMCESASLSFAYRKKRLEQQQQQQQQREGVVGAKRRGGRHSSSSPPEKLSVAPGEEADDDVSCVTGLSNLSGSTKGSRSSAASRASRVSRVSRTSGGSGSGGGRPAHVREPPRNVQRHPLYLLKARRLSEEIKFSGGMGHDDCAKFYKLRNLDFVVEKPPPPPKKAQRRHQQASSTPPPTADMSPAKRAMVERLREMEARRRMQQQQQQQGDAKAKSVQPRHLEVPKMIDDSSASNSTLSTVGLDESLGSLNDSQHSCDAAGRRRRRPRFSVSFSKTVSVHRVPSAQSYPAKVYESVWYSRTEWTVQKRTCRLELMSDGSDWRKATEEGDYVQCPKTRKAVHPVHVKGLTEGRRIELGNNPMKLLSPATTVRKQQPKKSGKTKSLVPKKGAMAA